MSKTTNPSNTISLQPGDRVSVRTAATLDTACHGTIFAISKGWYVVDLAPETAPEILKATKGRVSARASSIEAPAPAPTKAPAAKAAPLPEECPECGGTDLDLGNTNGYVCLECDHEWLPEADEEAGVEELLDEAEQHASKMTEALKKARVRYVKDRRPNGAATAHNGDLIARELRDYDPAEVCGLCDRCFDLPKGSTFAKYEHLNPGQRRMNAGNRIRAVWKKAEDLERMQRIAQVLGLDDELADLLAAKAAEHEAELAQQPVEGK